MKKKLLLVENSDSFDSLNDVGPLLTGQYDIVKSNTGKGAVQILKNENIDALLLDLVLQDMDGLDLLKTIRTDISRTLPVMIVNDHGNTANVTESLQYGAYDIVRKDISFEYLHATISNAMECHQVRLALQKFQSIDTETQKGSGTEPDIKTPNTAGKENSKGSGETFFDGDKLLDYKQADRKFKKEYFGHLLKLMNGNISKAADKAGITRQGLHKILNGLKKAGVE